MNNMLVYSIKSDYTNLKRRTRLRGLYYLYQYADLVKVIRPVASCTLYLTEDQRVSTVTTLHPLHYGFTNNVMPLLRIFKRTL